MYVEIGITSDSSEEMVKYLKIKGYHMIDGIFPYCTLVYNGKKDKVNPNKKLIKYKSFGRETNEVNEVFLELEELK